MPNGWYGGTSSDDPEARRPWIAAEVKFEKGSPKTIAFQIDTGADVTLVSPADFDRFGVAIRELSGRFMTAYGLNGQGLRYKSVLAQIRFPRAGAGAPVTCALGIVVPGPWKRLRDRALAVGRNHASPPSVLGTDIICGYRLILDFSRQEVELA